MPPALINIVLLQHLPGDCAAFSHSLLRSGVITWHISPESLWWKSLANPVKYLECFPVILIPPLRPRKAQNNIKRQSVERDHVPLKQLHLSPLPSLFPSNVRTDVIKVKEKKKKILQYFKNESGSNLFHTLCSVRLVKVKWCLRVEVAADEWPDVEDDLFSDAYLTRVVSPLSPQTMRRCLAPNATAVTLRLMPGIASWRPWATAGTTRASSVL